MKQQQIESLAAASYPEIERYLTMHCTIASPEIATTVNHSDRSPLTQKDKEMIASVLSWDMCGDIQAHEIITIAINRDIVQILLTGNRTALLPVESFKSILQQHREQQELDDIEYIAQLEAKLEKNNAETEVECQGKIHKVWRGIRLLGIFYRVGRSWEAEPTNREPLSGFRTASAAKSAILCLATVEEKAA